MTSPGAAPPRPAASPRRATGTQVVWLCWIAMFAEGYDMSALGAVLPGMLADPAWKLTPLAAGAIASAALAGMFFGGYGFGVAADRFSRKRAFMSCLSLFSLSSLVAALAPWPAMFAVARFFCGVGVGGIVPICSAYVYEFSPADRANRRYAIMYSGYTIGILAAALTAYALLAASGWRIVIALGVLPLLLLPVLARWLPESMDYLLARGREAEAAAIAARFGVAPPAGLHAAPPAGAGAGLRIILAPRHVRATIGFWLATFAGMIVVYGLTTWLPQIMRSAGYALGPSILFLGVFALASSFGGVLLGAIADRVGRAPTTFAAFALGAAAIALLAHRWPLGWTYALVALAGIGTISAAVMVTSYLSAYFPASVRATAVGACLSVSRSGAVCGPMVGGLIASYRLPFEWNFWAYAAAALLAGAAILLPPPGDADIG